MKKLTQLLSTMLIVGLGLATPSLAEEAQGDWQGKIGGVLRMNVYVTKSADGHYEAALESPDQGGGRLKADTVEVTPTTLKFTTVRAHGEYSGTWDEEQKAWVGTWSQGRPYPLVLKRIPAETH